MAPLFLHHLQLTKWIIYDGNCNLSSDIPSIFVCKIKEFVHENISGHHSRKVFHLLMDYGYQDCKVEFNQPFCWLYFVQNLLVI